MAVGDDWQAINGFAGSDLRYFGDFFRHFHETSTREIATNYQSAISVVQAGNALMRGRGSPGVSRPNAPQGNVFCLRPR